MMYPFLFKPIFKERIWGGRNIQRLFGKELPEDDLIGESWEIVDREGDTSTIVNGPLAGKTLRWLMENASRELLGSVAPSNGRFPLLVKILDASQTLSLQVHPPAAIAAQFGGEPKTEFWYVVHAERGAELFAGLKKGITRADFVRKIETGEVADCFHRIQARSGDALFLPSGRVHALGAGNVIFEVQQNSDTTYRVFDWNRLDAQGKPRDLHVEQSLASIDFNDHEPALASRRRPEQASPTRNSRRELVRNELFYVTAENWRQGMETDFESPSMQILGVVSGSLLVRYDAGEIRLSAGQFCIIPASLISFSLIAESTVEFLRISAN